MAYICNNCGEELLGWAGKCPFCNAWGTIEENLSIPTIGKAKGKAKSGQRTKGGYAVSNLIEGKSETKEYFVERIKSGIGEFDRVLGGGIFPGEVILMSGQPGIGKSTLLLQVVQNLSFSKKVLYISGEESLEQVRNRYYRIDKKTFSGGVNINEIKEKNNKDNNTGTVLFSSETTVEVIIDMIDTEKPDLVVVDSIQTLESENHQSYPGSISQVKICGAMLTKLAKNLSVPIIMIGQINKQGLIAGPKILEHLVDCVIYFEGDEKNQFRILRCIKNRFGSINEIGVFHMGESGLEEVLNPTNVFLENEKNYSGSAVGAVEKGSRVIFLEVQALVIERDTEGIPLKRVANGIKRNKIDILCAILSKRGGVYLGNKDVFLNIVGGMEVEDPSLDLAICAAIKSAVSERSISFGTVFSGEVGLTGSIKSTWFTKRVVEEAIRLGYKKVVTGKVDSKSSKYKKESIEVSDIVGLNKVI